MMTPDRESCLGVLSRQRSLYTIQGAWFHDECMGPLSFVGGISIGRDAARDLVHDAAGKFTREILEKRLRRPMGDVFEVSAPERMANRLVCTLPIRPRTRSACASLNSS